MKREKLLENGWADPMRQQKAEKQAFFVFIELNKKMVVNNNKNNNERPKNRRYELHQSIA